MYSEMSSVFNITEFGAVPGGTTDCTGAFKRAVAACVEKGGGTVYVPAGVFFTGPIHLASNITLFLDSGSKLIFSSNEADFPLVNSRWEGEDSPVYSPLIFADHAENVTVCGRGVLDGRGRPWWELHRLKQVKHPRPRFICFQNSSNILIEGITLIDSPAWTINPVMSSNLTVRGITIRNPYDSPNTDGINPDSCSDVHISDCYIDVGDDCVTLKSGTEDCSVKVPCQNITVTNCTMVHGHGGVVIGSEMSGDVRNVAISNCIFRGTDRGIRIKSRRGRGGTVEDIVVSNIVMKDVFCPFVMHLYYSPGKNGRTPYVRDKNPHPVNEGTPRIRRVQFSNIAARNVHAAAGFIYGLPEMPIEEISFDNVSVTMTENPVPERPAMLEGQEPVAAQGFFLRNARDISFNNISIKGQRGQDFEAESVDGLKITRR